MNLNLKHKSEIRDFDDLEEEEKVCLDILYKGECKHKCPICNDFEVKK